MGRLASCFFLLILASFAVHAQLRVISLPHGNAHKEAEPRTNRAGRNKEVKPLSLPFFDDFTKVFYDSSQQSYPDTSHWETSYTVWVNSGLAINGPTLNAATFDGLDSAGLAYNPTQIFLNGFTDSLVSRAIDMSETAPSPVTLSDRNSVYLSFYYEWKGNGEAPDQSDYLQVQFRNQSGDWETVYTINSSQTLDPTLFYPAVIKVEGDRFFYNRFQFRIRSFGRQSGPYDTWHIDYVYLNKGRTSTDMSFPDQAISSHLSSIFENKYRSIPYYHFLVNPTFTSPQYRVFNLRGNPPDVLNYYLEGVFTNYTNGVAAVNTLSNLDPNPAPPNTEGINDDGTGTIFPFETRVVNVKYMNTIDTLSVLDPNADSVKMKLKVNLVTGDVIDPETGGPAADYDPKYAPIDFRLNDTLSNTFHLKDYYAYDDGVAEYAGSLVAAGNVFAYEFPLNENLPDTLRLLEGFDIYFPPFGLTSNQTVDFFVFDELDNRPDKILVRISSVSIRNMGVNKFQRIKFLPALQITKNKFYIGWRQPVAGQVLVGIDNSNDTGDRMFFNTDGNINPDPLHWEHNTLVHGSFMVRPVFGHGFVDLTTGIETPASADIYPNPSRGNFVIEEKVERMEIVSTTGRVIPFESETRDNSTFVQVHTSPGVYILRYVSHAKIHTQKIVITQ